MDLVSVDTSSKEGEAEDVARVKGLQRAWEEHEADLLSPVSPPPCLKVNCSRRQTPPIKTLQRRDLQSSVS